ncbi:MAG: DegV family protein [Anaerolineales bacterium]|nr:DegV family protein [Anaerolineales bacterium]
MTIRIVTDSTCDIPQMLIEEHNIAVVPLYIHLENQSYLDGIDLTRQAFYERLPSCRVPPTTAVPGTEMFKQTYKRLADEGATRILSIHISPTLSAVKDVATIAAQEFKSVPVTVLDSRQLSMGAGFIVLAAARAADQGHSMDEILALLEDMIPRTYVFAALDTMEYLRRSGRVSWLVSGVGNFLSIKPILKMNDGEATSEQVRTDSRALQRLVDLVQELGSIEQLALVHTNAPEKAATLGEFVKEEFPYLAEPISVNVTSVLGAHLGPGTAGVACVAAPSGT